MEAGGGDIAGLFASIGVPLAPAGATDPLARPHHSR